MAACSQPLTVFAMILVGLNASATVLYVDINSARSRVVRQPHAALHRLEHRRDEYSGRDRCGKRGRFRRRHQRHLQHRRTRSLWVGDQSCDGGQSRDRSKRQRAGHNGYCRLHQYRQFPAFWDTVCVSDQWGVADRFHFDKRMLAQHGRPIAGTERRRNMVRSGQRRGVQLRPGRQLGRAVRGWSLSGHACRLHAHQQHSGFRRRRVFKHDDSLHAHSEFRLLQ